jgi:hypothetical protein
VGGIVIIVVVPTHGVDSVIKEQNKQRMIKEYCK